MKKLPEIKGYQIKKKLGQGGMATVFLAIENQLNRLCALKVLIPNVFGDQRDSKRFLKESKTLKKLNHPNIVSIYSVGEFNDMYYISMEYFQKSLSDLIKSDKGISTKNALYIVSEISEAIFYLNSKDLIHRDIKPDNIMFRNNHEPVLLDFGIAKHSDSQTKITKTGAFIGTPQYMSPEQCALQKVTYKSDLYALGVVLFEMLTGSPPFKSKDTRTIIMKHLTAPVPQLPKKHSVCQPLIDMLMAKKRSGRPSSNEQIRRLIKKILGSVAETPDKSVKKTPVQRKKNKKTNTSKTVVSGRPVKRQISVKKKKRKLAKPLTFILFAVCTAITVIYIFSGLNPVEQLSFLFSFLKYKLIN